ncbi:LysM domain-containing protein [Blastococcus aurantiacus]|uniref:LysM domain-containing protein n=2 Tax=Blastococcus aurantiacus TaxID=1550231 RepID=A0A1G7IAZ5_9ACTN|nr:LysM domain-containing protein [Blastococcus aurantiacus]
MGGVAQAVVEFDEAVQAPWRPPLASGSGRVRTLRAVPDLAPRTPAASARAGRMAADAAASRPRPSGNQLRRPLPAGTASPRRPAVPGRAVDERSVPGVRLTRRARRLGVVLGLAVGIAVGSCVGSAVAGDDEGGLRLAGESSVVVHPGDTLWSIAAAVAGEGDDVRDVVADIRELNELPDAVVVPGQVLLLP